MAISIVFYVIFKDFRALKVLDNAQLNVTTWVLVSPHGSWLYPFWPVNTIYTSDILFSHGLQYIKNEPNKSRLRFNTWNQSFCFSF